VVLPCCLHNPAPLNSIGVRRRNEFCGTRSGAVKGFWADLRASLERLEPLLGERASLDPGRPCAPTLVELTAQIVGERKEAERARAFARGLGEVVRAVADDFPDNIFWDLEYLACCMWRAGGVAEIHAFARRVTALCRGFGNKSQLRFRYAHDFLYGYDWSRWVSRMPAERAGIGPFDIAFFDYLEDRRLTLLDLIARNDAKYGKLQGQAYRNPFGFRREPHEETRLHRELSRADLLPVKAWRVDGERRWDLPFTELRAEVACRLGIARGAAR